MIERLNQLFGISDAVSFARGANNFPKVVLSHHSRHRLEVYLYGAQITSWLTPESDALLFLSSRAHFERGKPIRGGVPLVFPQFGVGDLPPHGFVRTQQWDVKSTHLEDDGTVVLKLVLQDTALTQKIWAYNFNLELTIRLTGKLSTGLKVYNCGTIPFFFYAAFHSYFQVGKLAEVHVNGLKGITYMDSLKNREYGVETRAHIDFSQPIDRIYLNAPEIVSVVDRSLQREIRVEKREMNEVVVWNPGAERGRSIEDLGENEFQHFVCVEPAIINKKITLEPLKGFECAQEISYARI